MRIWRKGLAAALALVLIFSIAAVSVSAETEAASNSKTVYTCLGDSIAAGYSLPEYVERIQAGLVRVNGSYGAIVADALSVGKYNAYGTSGVRTEEMLMFLKDGYYGDAVTSYNMHYWVHTDKIDEELPVLQKKIRDGIAESSLITLGVGVNDLWLTVEGILLQLGTGKPYQGPEKAQEEYINQVEENGISQTEELVQTSIELVMGTATLVPQLLTAIADALLGFNSRYEEILTRMRELNKDAVIVEVGIYNPFDILTPGFNGIIDMYFGQMNDFLKKMSEKYENIYYADVTGTETIFGTTLANDPHPTQKGHEYMAEQILGVLKGIALPNGSVIPADVTPAPSATPVPVADTVCEPYKDIDTSEWYHEAVHYAIEKKIMGGTAGDTFAPNVPVTRGMIAQMIYAMEGRPLTFSANRYQDVKSGMYYVDAIAFVSRNKIMTGYDDRHFGPEDRVTREQLATLLRGYALYLRKSTEKAASITGYADAGAVSEWAFTSMEWAVGSGIIAGRDGNKLAPQANATRAEVAQMLMKFRSF